MPCNTLIVTHLQFIQNQHAWPCWPMLPIRKPALFGDWEHGLLISCGSAGYTLLDVSIHNLPTDPEAFLKSRSKDYTTAEAVVADGWIVDEIVD
jgi:hypothetical protein